MNLELLPEKIKIFLGSLEELVIEEREIKFTQSVNPLRKIVKDLLLNQIQPYYAQRGQLATTGIYNFLIEPLKNANFHSNKGQNTITQFRMLLTPTALIAGYNDGGVYFTRKDIKELYEKGLPDLEKHHTTNKEIGYGCGATFRIELSDLIYVENQTGTLFQGISTSKNILFNNNPKP